MITRFFFTIFLCFLLFKLIAQQPVRELRGIWVATVKNIDFPSKAGLSPGQQQTEIIQLLDFHQKNGINTIFFQIRPAADAFYQSNLEPWSEWLTGKQGKKPEPFFDPLAFMLAECRKRAMELHAWFNPYRALVDVDSVRLANFGLYSQHPDWFLQYGKNLYFDPANPEVRNYGIQVVMDVVRNYDIDGIHFDDYFYPYKIKDVEFPDSLSFKRFGGSFQNKEDWRRNNVSIFIQNLGDSLRKNAPYIKYGISPFGVWRNKDKDLLGSDSKAGQTCYDDLYADVRLWLQKGWIDYIAPQLYFSIGYPPADYQKLLNWWKNNAFGKHIYIGHGAYKIKANPDTNWNDALQIPKQIQMNRQLKEVHGSIYFSAKSFKTNPLQINDQLQKDLYRTPALLPKMEWKKLNHSLPANLPINYQNQQGNLVVKLPQIPQFSGYWVIFRTFKKNPIEQQNPAQIVQVVHTSQTEWKDSTSKKGKKYTYSFVLLDRLWNETNNILTQTLKIKGKRKIKITGN